MRRSKITRGQRLILTAMALALVAVLVALGSFIRRQDAPSPLPTAALSVPQTTVTAQIDPVPSPVSATRVPPTPTRIEIGGEVLAARRIEGGSGWRLGRG